MLRTLLRRISLTCLILSLVAAVANFRWYWISIGDGRNLQIQLNTGTIRVCWPDPAATRSVFFNGRYSCTAEAVEDFEPFSIGTAGQDSLVQRYIHGWTRVRPEYDQFFGTRAACFPLWWLLAAFGLAYGLCRIGRTRLRQGVCPRCKYDLTGNVSGRCPECFEAVTTTGSA